MAVQTVGLLVFLSQVIWGTPLQVEFNLGDAGKSGGKSSMDAGMIGDLNTQLAAAHNALGGSAGRVGGSVGFKNAIESGGGEMGINTDFGSRVGIGGGGSTGFKGHFRRGGSMGIHGGLRGGSAGGGGFESGFGIGGGGSARISGGGAGFRNGLNIGSDSAGSLDSSFGREGGANFHSSAKFGSSLSGGNGVGVSGSSGVGSSGGNGRFGYSFGSSGGPGVGVSATLGSGAEMDTAVETDGALGSDAGINLLSGLRNSFAVGGNMGIGNSGGLSNDLDSDSEMGTSIGFDSSIGVGNNGIDKSGETDNEDDESEGSVNLTKDIDVGGIQSSGLTLKANSGGGVTGGIGGSLGRGGRMQISTSAERDVGIDSDKGEESLANGGNMEVNVGSTTNSIGGDGGFGSGDLSISGAGLNGEGEMQLGSGNGGHFQVDLSSLPILGALDLEKAKLDMINGMSLESKGSGGMQIPGAGFTIGLSPAALLNLEGAGNGGGNLNLEGAGNGGGNANLVMTSSSGAEGSSSASGASGLGAHLTNAGAVGGSLNRFRNLVQHGIGTGARTGLSARNMITSKLGSLSGNSNINVGVSPAARFKLGGQASGGGSSRRASLRTVKLPRLTIRRSSSTSSSS